MDEKRKSTLKLLEELLKEEQLNYGGSDEKEKNERKGSSERNDEKRGN